MNLKRFQTLAETYGGDVTRWPPSEREAAASVMAADPVGAQAALSRAADVDALLNAVAPTRGSEGLSQRIAAGAPRPRHARRLAWLLPAGMGAGLAAACAAGVVAGVHLSAAQAPSGDGESVMTAVSDDGFGDLDEEA